MLESLDRRLDSLSHAEDSTDCASTAQMYQVSDLLNRRLEAQLANGRKSSKKDLPTLNQLMHSQGVPELQAPTGIPKEQAGHPTLASFAKGWVL